MNSLVCVLIVLGIATLAAACPGASCINNGHKAFHKIYCFGKRSVDFMNSEDDDYEFSSASERREQCVANRPPLVASCCSYHIDSNGVCARHPKVVFLEKCLGQCKAHVAKRQKMVDAWKKGRTGDGLKRCFETIKKRFTCSTVPRAKKQLLDIKKRVDICSANLRKAKAAAKKTQSKKISKNKKNSSKKSSNKKNTKNFEEELFEDLYYGESTRERDADARRAEAAREAFIEKWGFPENSAAHRTWLATKAAYDACQKHKASVDKAYDYQLARVEKLNSGWKKCKASSKWSQIRTCRKNTRLLEGAIAECKGKLSRCRSKVVNLHNNSQGVKDFIKNVKG